jgi:hypothetical protein
MRRCAVMRCIDCDPRRALAPPQTAGARRKPWRRRHRLGVASRVWVCEREIERRVSEVGQQVRFHRTFLVRLDGLTNGLP